MTKAALLAMMIAAQHSYTPLPKEPKIEQVRMCTTTCYPPPPGCAYCVQQCYTNCF